MFAHAGGNGPTEYVGTGGLSMADEMHSLLFVIKGSEWSSKLGCQASEMQYVG